MCVPTSVQGIRKLKETVHLQKLYVAMLEDGSAVKKEAKKALSVLKKELKDVMPRGYGPTEVY
ncbi:unnamed protein product [Ectocarpus sp. 12 AP-2014]